MLKMAMKIKAWAVESERKTALAAAGVAAEAAAVAAALAEPHASRKKGDTEKPPKKPEQEAPSEGKAGDSYSLLTDPAWALGPRSGPSSAALRTPEPGRA